MLTIFCELAESEFVAYIMLIVSVGVFNALDSLHTEAVMLSGM